jgi:hypothetical protein
MINEKDLRGRRRHLINTDSSFVWKWWLCRMWVLSLKVRSFNSRKAYSSLLKYGTPPQTPSSSLTAAGNWRVKKKRKARVKRKMKKNAWNRRKLCYKQTKWISGNKLSILNITSIYESIKGNSWRPESAKHNRKS